MRIGNGYDAHRFCEGRPLIMGGVEIPFELGLEGHSDADVLLHAISDALLGAAAMGDIGLFFPDTDERFKDISSLYILQTVNDLIKSRGFRIVNIDSTVIAQMPRFRPYVDQMRQNIASCLSIPADSVSVKATTEEHMGYTGRMEGIKAIATVLIENKGPSLL